MKQLFQLIFGFMVIAGIIGWGTGLSVPGPGFGGSLAIGAVFGLISWLSTLL